MMAEAEKLRAADQLDQLEAVNRGMSGGPGYTKLARRLVRRSADK